MVRAMAVGRPVAPQSVPALCPSLRGGPSAPPFFCVIFFFGHKDLSAACPVWLSTWRFWGLQTAAPGRLFPRLPSSPHDAGTRVLSQFHAFGSVCFCLDGFCGLSSRSLSLPLSRLLCGLCPCPLAYARHMAPLLSTLSDLSLTPVTAGRLGHREQHTEVVGAWHDGPHERPEVGLGCGFASLPHPWR